MIFHKQLGFPSYFRAPEGRYVLIPSRHASDRAREKNIFIPEKIDMHLFDVIEVVMNGTKITRMVIRGEYDDYDDICLVVAPRGNALFVVTVWLNHWRDGHGTLDRSRYSIP